MPFWTVIFIAGRMAIAPELYEAAAVDGATGLRRFAHITFPLLATLYFVNTLLSTIFSVGDFATPFFITNGGPALTSLYVGEPRHPRRLRPVGSQSRRRLRDVGAAADDPARHFPDAQIAHDGRGALTMTVIAVEGRARARSHADALRAVRAARRRRVLTNIGAAILSLGAGDLVGLADLQHDHGLAQLARRRAVDACVSAASLGQQLSG